MPPVTIYTLRGCPYCWRAKRLLRRKGARFQEIGTTKRAKERTAELRAEFAQRFGSTTCQGRLKVHPLAPVENAPPCGTSRPGAERGP